MSNKWMEGRWMSAHREGEWEQWQARGDVSHSPDMCWENELSLSCLGAVWITSKVKSTLNNIIVRLSIQENCFLWAEYKWHKAGVTSPQWAANLTPESLRQPGLREGAAGEKGQDCSHVWETINRWNALSIPSEGVNKNPFKLWERRPTLCTYPSLSPTRLQNKKTILYCVMGQSVLYMRRH